MQNLHKQKGFTLVEIAIVLVIIGLLLGGVLKGRELIASSKIKAAVQQVSSLQSAIYTFRDKYKYNPGDFNAAVATFGATFGGAAIANGNGNGFIENAERGQVFLQLQAAGLISGSSDGTDSATGYMRSEFGNAIIIDDGNPFVGSLSACYYGLDLDTANQLDIRVDGAADGTTGDVRRNNNTAYAATNNAVCFKL